MEKIMLIKIVKSEQYNSLILSYTKAESIDKDKIKGMTEYTQWINGKDNELFNKLDKNDFGKVIDADLGISEPNYKGECKQILKNILVNGKRIEIK